jgi:hypothetical protein
VAENDVPNDDDQRFAHGTERNRCFPCGRGQDWDDEHADHNQCEGARCQCPCRAPLDADERYALRAMLEGARS